MKQDPRLHRDRSVQLVPRVREGATVKIIGVGGVGGIVARYGATFLAALDRDLRLVLIDGDEFETSNATRMLFKHVGNKAAVTRDELREHLADAPLSILAIEDYVTAENIERLIQEGDIVILAVDNNATRKLVNDFCSSTRQNVCLISGGNDGWGEEAAGRILRGTYGNCQIYVRQDGRDVTPSLTREHPEIIEAKDFSPAEDCVQLAVSVPQILFANLLVAACILNTLWLYFCGAVHYSEVCFDLADALMRPIPLYEEELQADGHKAS